MSQPELSPIKLFDQKSRVMTDFSEYLKLLAQEGVPAMESIQRNESEEDIDRQYRMCIGLATARVLKNREESGLSNNIELIEHSFQEQGIREWMLEFIVDPNTRRRVAQGLVFGLEVAKVVPPAYLRYSPEE